MLELLGTACVGWTLFELHGLLRSARERSAKGDVHSVQAPCSRRRASPRRAASPRCERAPRFSAWDERGNRIVVEDLGSR